MKGSESFGDRGRPLIEPRRDERSGLGVGLGELTDERAKLAAPFALVLLAALITMFRQASTPCAPLSARLLRLTMESA
jgi:hypothetical protein